MTHVNNPAAEAPEGLRERKKRRTRQAIADAAAALFAERGYEEVTVLDVAEAAEVSEQTVYNHFPTKEHLVFDRADEMEARLLARVRCRPPGTPVISCIRDQAMGLLDQVAASPYPGRGGMPYLVATSPSLRRWALDLFARNAEALATVLAGEQRVAPGDPATLAVATALVGVLQVLITDLGRRLVEGQSARTAAEELRPGVERALAQLEEGLGRYGATPTRDAVG